MLPEWVTPHSIAGCQGSGTLWRVSEWSPPQNFCRPEQLTGFACNMGLTSLKWRKAYHISRKWYVIRFTKAPPERRFQENSSVKRIIYEKSDTHIGFWGLLLYYNNRGSFLRGCIIFRVNDTLYAVTMWSKLMKIIWRSSKGSRSCSKKDWRSYSTDY